MTEPRPLLTDEQIAALTPAGLALTLRSFAQLAERGLLDISGGVLERRQVSDLTTPQLVAAVRAAEQQGIAPLDIPIARAPVPMLLSWEALGDLSPEQLEALAELAP